MNDPDRVDQTSIASSNTASRVARLRHRLIKRIARGDVVLLNALVVIPPGWSIGRKELDQGGMIVDCAFVTDVGYESMPGSVIMSRDLNS